MYVSGDIKRLHDNLAPHKDLVKDLTQIGIHGTRQLIFLVVVLEQQVKLTAP